MVLSDLHRLKELAGLLEGYSLYDISLSPELEVLSAKEISKLTQLAYAVNPESYTIIVSKSGHGKIMRNYDKHDFEGGWLFPLDKKITFYSGYLGEVSDKDKVKDAFEKFFDLNLKVANK
jgi:hypothetical protein